MKLIHRLLLKVRPAYVASFLKKILGIKRILVTKNEGIFLLTRFLILDPTFCPNKDMNHRWWIQ